MYELTTKKVKLLVKLRVEIQLKKLLITFHKLNYYQNLIY